MTSFHGGVFIMSCCAVILAAGDGKRMKSSKPKVMCEVLGDPMIEWVTDSVREAGISDEDIAVVVGSGAEAVTSFLAGKGSFRIFTQSERKGTGHAVMQATEMLEKHENVLVLYGDAPFADSGTVLSALNEHTHRGNDVTVVTADIPDPADYGRIIRSESGDLTGIADKKDCTSAQLEITEVDSGIYWFRSEALAKALTKLNDNNAAGEYHLSDTVGIILSEGGKAGTFTADDPDIVLGADSCSELLRLNIIAKMNVIGKLLGEGVEFVSTDGIIIGRKAVIGRDTVILPGTIIRGETVIGEGCTIGPNTLIENCYISGRITENSDRKLYGRSRYRS